MRNCGTFICLLQQASQLLALLLGGNGHLILNACPHTQIKDENGTLRTANVAKIAAAFDDGKDDGGGQSAEKDGKDGKKVGDKRSREAGKGEDAGIDCHPDAADCPAPAPAVYMVMVCLPAAAKHSL